MSTRPFFDTLREIRRGAILDDCADELARLVRAVDETGKSGTLTITLSVKPASKGTGVYNIADKVKAKLPELPVGETIMFGTPDGNLQARNPSQPDLTGLKEVSGPSDTPKTINSH